MAGQRRLFRAVPQHVPHPPQRLVRLRDLRQPPPGHGGSPSDGVCPALPRRRCHLPRRRARHRFPAAFQPGPLFLPGRGLHDCQQRRFHALLQGLRNLLHDGRGRPEGLADSAFRQGRV